MKRSLAARFVRGAARLSAALYPRAFRREYGRAFADAAEDRLQRERSRGASPAPAIATTIRILIADAVSGQRLARRRPQTAGPEARRTLMFDRLIADVRYALRGMARAPMVTVVAAVSLAIGIGANTAIFTVVNTLLIAPPAGIAMPDRVVDIGRASQDHDLDTLSYPTYADFRDRSTTMSGVFALRPEPGPLSLDAPEGAQLVHGMQVSTSYFDVLGVVPAAGTLFRSSDDSPNVALRTVVLSHPFWVRKYGADPGIVGRTLVLNGDEFSVTGVAGKGFQGTTIIAPDVWIPLTAASRATAPASQLRSRSAAWLMLGGRLKPGVTIDQARAEAAAFSAAMRTEHPAPDEARDVQVEPPNRALIGRSVLSLFLAFLMSLVGLVLLVACANLGGLLLARAAGRSREVAVRLALGASRRSLVRMFLIESVLLFLPGALLALLVARGAVQMLQSLLPQLPVPVAADFALDWRVVMFTLGVAFATAILTGLAPALHASRPDLVPDLKGDAQAPRRQRLRRLFVSAQMAFCVVLIALAGLFGRALRAASTAEPGFRIEGIEVASLDLGLAGYKEDQLVEVTNRLRERLQAIPGVRTVAVSAVVPLADQGLGLGPLRRPGDREVDTGGEVDWNVVSPEFMPALRMAITRGRGFTDADRLQTPLVAVVNEQFARVMWPSTDPIGQVLENPGSGPEPTRRLTVVGIARDTKYRGLGDRARSFIYVPIAQTPWERPSFFLVRDDRVDPSASLQPAVRATLLAFDRHLPLISMLPFTQYAQFGLVPQRIGAAVAGALGILALLLAGIGVYGLMAFLVSSRTRDIGVRVALGADHRRLMRLVLWQGLRLSLTGGLVGLGIALLAAPVIREFLFGISPADPVAFGGTIVTLVAVATLAIVVPARRATRVNPVTALRSE